MPVKIDFAMVYEMKFGQFLLHIQNSVLVIAFFLLLKASLRKQPFLLALRRWGRFARRNVCDSAKEIP